MGKTLGLSSNKSTWDKTIFYHSKKLLKTIVNTSPPLVMRTFYIVFKKQFGLTYQTLFYSWLGTQTKDIGNFLEYCNMTVQMNNCGFPVRIHQYLGVKHTREITQCSHKQYAVTHKVQPHLQAILEILPVWTDSQSRHGEEVYISTNRNQQCVHFTPVQ